MTDPKAKSIPEWQRGPSSDSSSEPELKVIEPKPLSDAAAAEPDAPASRTELVSQAASWLEHAHIRDAPLEGKISFLEGKGLSKEEINSLLGTEEADTANSNSHPTPSDPNEEAVVADPSVTSDTASETALPEPSADNSVPPIITYPEFLLKPTPKPPLISRTTLLRTIYGTAITAGAVHLASKYLVEPMFAELSSSRHQLFDTASTHLNVLNEKLKGMVSVIPLDAAVSAQKHSDHSQDSESEASDPDELFHRDIGVQTSEPSSPNSSVADALSPGGKISAQSAKLQALRSHLASLNESCTDSVTAMQSVESEMVKLDTLLDDLRYARRNTMLKGDSMLPYGVNWTGSSSSRGKEDEDEIDRIKTEIKGVKGVLLSARSFPRSGTWPANAR